MQLTGVLVTDYKSIANSSDVAIDPDVTVLVGQNEAGKTAFLQALEKSHSIRDAKFNVMEDYPRKHLNEYLRQHATNPAPVIKLTYDLDDDEADKISAGYGAAILRGRQFTKTLNYSGGSVVNFPDLIDESAYLQQLLTDAPLTQDIRAKCLAAKRRVADIIAVLDAGDLNEEEKTWREALKVRFKEVTWDAAVAHEVWRTIQATVPKFLYFDEYQLLPGKINLASLAQRVSSKTALTDEDETIIRLFEMADVDVKTLIDNTGYEEAKARLEGLSNTITDQIFEYWTQNKELDVEFDIREDSKDPDPRFQQGANLYIRIKNRKHRVTVSFSQRSKGFIWFFSFIVWFTSVSRSSKGKELILLLDEPGLNLHALAQADFLRYIDNLSDEHQVIYSTHSPFMVHSNRLHQVRVVEDRTPEGTVVSGNIGGSDAKTIFPLQAALGYTIAQNLFISPKNLLVEGPADLVYLRYFSDVLDSAGRTGLDGNITIVPAGGLDKLATFVALLGANDLQVVVLHDWASQADQRLECLVRDKIIKAKHVLNYGQFRVAAGTKAPATDVEDLITLEKYLDLFATAFKQGLGNRTLAVSGLPIGDRVVDRLSRLLIQENIQLRPSGGYNHYGPASYLASHPMKFDKETLNRFEQLFIAINATFKAQ